MRKDLRFLIVGLGLIGGSFAKVFKANGFEVGAIDLNEESIDYAINKGLIDEGMTCADKNFIQSYDVVLIGLYPKAEYEWILNYQQYFKPGTVVFDVAGVKGENAFKIRDIVRKDIEMVFTHPMAGREVSGVKNCDETIFAKANFIIVPDERNSKEYLAFIEEIGKMAGFKKISYLSIEEHDEMIGFVSQLTHVIAIALMTCNNDENLQNYTGDSFRDLTRIARINENMWSELFIENKKQLVNKIDEFVNQMEYLKELVNNEDCEKLKEVMVYSTKRRALFDKERND